MACLQDLAGMTGKAETVTGYQNYRDMDCMKP